MPITSLLEHNATLFTNDVALVEINPGGDEKPRMTWREYSLIESSSKGRFRKELTWGEFNVQANRTANLLLSRGIRKGDKVAILMMNCIEWLPIYFGILKTGAVVVPLNFRYTAEEIKYCCKLADVDAIVFGPEFVGRMEEICDRLSDVRLMLYAGEDCPSFAESYEELIGYCSSRTPQIDLKDSDDGAIYFSSGTTGFPKAILHEHRSLMHSCKVEQAHHGQKKEDVFLCIPPLYHTGAKMHWFGSLITGGKAVLLRGTKPEWILKAVSEEGCTILWLLVPWCQDILDALDREDLRIEDFHLDQLRLMHIGAQPVPASLIKRWKGYFPDHQYDTNYGLSESIGPGCVHLGVENVHKVGAIGKAGFGWEVKIVDEARGLVKKGEVGELAVRGPGVMKCYYHDEQATRETLYDGWLMTGDMAYEDPEGFIFLVDRKKDVIISGGENIYPVQIENFLRKNDDISDCAVIGVPDSRLGEISAAIIQIKEGHKLSEDDVNEFCLELPRYKRPHKIIFADVPRNPTGKIEKPVLRERYGSLNIVDQQNRS